ncbi:MAG: fibronectin type III domain-containing protein, partial [Dehalobacter sp.]|nr:fibronectin type III domain-containing protein [Dehalobacter sp.]
MKKKMLIALSLILLLIGNSLPAKAVEQVNKVTYSKKYYLQESHKKISSDLLKLIDEQYRTNKETKEQVKSSIKNMKALIKAEDSSSYGLNKSNDDLVYVYIRVNDNESTHIIDNYANKVKNRDEKNHVITAWVEVNKINVIASLEGVRSVNTVLPPQVNVGSVTSQGDALQNVDSFRNLSGIDGTGVKIGIISDGVDNLASAQATGDLPGDVVTLSNTVGGDEGTAMLEIVHDLAPGAQLYFHDCGDNELAFNDAVDALVNAGCQVICDDIGWITQPFFEDGIIASHISSVIDSNNIVYVSSAGNEAQNHYQGTFRADNTGYYFHDFDPSSAGYSPLLVYIPYGETVRVVLEWNDRWGASSNDYDLILADLDGPPLVSSIEEQNGDGYPVELVYWTNTDASGYYQIVVPKYAGVAKTLELYVYGGYIADGYYTSSDSIFGHAAVPKVIAVGAANADSPNKIAYYSSQGPVTISYPSAVKRNKPDIIGIDGVSVTGAGSFSNPFYGTSAAAPDVAAIAGLLWAQNPSKSASDIRTIITRGGVDLGTTGYDTIYGYGLLNMILAASPCIPVGLAAAPSDKSAIISWTANAESDIAGYQLEYKTTAATNWTVKTLAGTVTSTTVGSLSNGGTYQFRLKAKDSAGNFSGYTDIVTCIPVDNVAPGVPTNFRMTSVNDSRIVLAWTAPTATDLSGYRIAYQKAGDTEWTETGTIAKIVTYTLMGLENDINYKLKIQSRDSAGNWSAYSSEVEAMPQDKTPPAVPTGLTTLVGTDKTIQISWTANTETDLDGYEIAWQKYGTTIWQSEVVGKETLSKTVENLTHNARYYFKVRAKDLKGNWSNYSTVVYAIAKDQVAPASPVGLAAAPSDKSAIISWTANAESDIAGYQLEYKTTAATNWTVKTLA